MNRDTRRTLVSWLFVAACGASVAIALVPLAIATNFLGIWLVRVTPEAMFYQITNVIVLLLGCELTRQGVTELLH